MQCERLINLAKSWYISVKDETMAPARMVQFIKQHVSGCPLCQEDPDIQDEIVRITEIILPESKIPKAVRLKQEQEEAALEAENEEEEDEDTDDVDTDEDEDTFVDDDEDEEEDVSPLAEKEEF